MRSKIGFFTDGRMGAFCLVDDVSLVRTGSVPCGQQLNSPSIMKSAIRKSLFCCLLLQEAEVLYHSAKLTVKITKTDSNEEILTEQGSLEAALSGVPPDSGPR